MGLIERLWAGKAVKSHSQRWDARTSSMIKFNKKFAGSIKIDLVLY
ncbi:hypothetical protein [Thermoplasma sp. Kam2015]|nr:hypothetical protein [Thermoplasma sp. Kam2015]